MSDNVQDRAPPMAAAPPSWKEKMEPWFFILPSVILLLAIGLYPVIYTLIASLQLLGDGHGRRRSSAELQNYIHAFTSSDFTQFGRPHAGAHHHYPANRTLHSA